MKFKVVVEGLMLIEVEAPSEVEAYEVARNDEQAQELYSLEVLEVVEADEPLRMYTDLN